MKTLMVGIDIGGTFTDFVIYNPITRKINTFKLPSTPQDPSQAVLSGLALISEEIGNNPSPRTEINTLIVHGSTVATNILLERKGVPTALITTSGFADVIQIGRQNRPSLYDFSPELPAPLVPSNLRFEVVERVDHQGSVLVPLEPNEVDAVIKKISETGVKSISICLLFSFLHPDHEQMLGEKLCNKGFHVSLSSEIHPVFREYERMSTTTVNAYVSPAMNEYLTNLETSITEKFSRTHSNKGIKNSPTLRIMQSNGGSISIHEARREPVRCILSGPAGGVIGSSYIGRIISKELNQNFGIKNNIRLTKKKKILTFDMGGTSTDVSVIGDKTTLTTDSIINGCPINIPMLDIHTIGAGGGSIAYIDAGGILRVGPESAGADPGPACYGFGTFPTVTDANLILGRIPPKKYLGGKIHLNYSKAYSVVKTLGMGIGLSAEETALGIISIANAHMERALRVITVERGHDPRELLLLSFGGAGGLHACNLAQNLGVQQVLIPPMASTLSAFGMLVANVVKDYSQTVMFLCNKPFDEINELIKHLEAKGRKELLKAGFSANKTKIECYLNMRYQGQSYELSVPYTSSFVTSFHRLHKRQYGYAKLDSLIEIVNIHVRAIGLISPPLLEKGEFRTKNPVKAFYTMTNVILNINAIMIPLYNGEMLEPGNRIKGPALISRIDTTILLPHATRAAVDGYGNLRVEVR